MRDVILNRIHCDVFVRKPPQLSVMSCNTDEDERVKITGILEDSIQFHEDSICMLFGQIAFCNATS